MDTSVEEIAPNILCGMCGVGMSRSRWPPVSGTPSSGACDGRAVAHVGQRQHDCQRSAAGPQRNFPAASRSHQNQHADQRVHRATVAPCLIKLPDVFVDLLTKECSDFEPAARRRRRPARSVGPGRLAVVSTTGRSRPPGCSVYLSSPRSSLPSCRRQTSSPARPSHLRRRPRGLRRRSG